MRSEQSALDRYSDQRVFERLARERKRDKWKARERFAERVRAVNRHAVESPEEWIGELLETEAILG